LRAGFAALCRRGRPGDARLAPFAAAASAPAIAPAAAWPIAATFTWCAISSASALGAISDLAALGPPPIRLCTRRVTGRHLRRPEVDVDICARARFGARGSLGTRLARATAASRSIARALFLRGGGRRCAGRRGRQGIGVVWVHARMSSVRGGE